MVKIIYLLSSFFILTGALAGELQYLTPESIDLSSFTPPTADLVTVLKLQKERTKSDCERASVEAKGFADAFFGPPYGPLSQREAEALVAFQEKLFQEVKYFTKSLKTKYQTPRPYTLSALVTPCVPTENSFSYPSGHAAIAVVSAKTLALLHPNLKSQLLERARVISFDRVLGGVHFPGDVDAGFLLGEMIFERLSSQEKFMKDVKDLKK